jgi:hypothetical protein
VFWVNLRCVQGISSGPLRGRHIVLKVEHGATVNLYADQNRTLVAYMEIPYLHMHSVNWFVLNWGLEDLGPGFDPLSVRASQSNAKRSKLKLPRSLHLVPRDQTLLERRRRVFRRLRNVFTCGACPVDAAGTEEASKQEHTSPRRKVNKPRLLPGDEEQRRQYTSAERHLLMSAFAMWRYSRVSKGAAAMLLSTIPRQPSRWCRLLYSPPLPPSPRYGCFTASGRWLQGNVLPSRCFWGSQTLAAPAVAK